MTWYVTRQPNGALASIHRDHMDGDNDETLADDSPAVIAFLAAANPPSKPSPRAWLERLAPAKQQAIMSAALANAALLLWIMKAAGEGTIDVTDPEAVSGVAALVAAGVLTAADQTLLLAP